jgi:hypothetical protein
MRVYSVKEVTVEERDFVRSHCDKCGAESEYIDGNTEVHIEFGYGSDFDMQHWSFDICDKCIKEFTDTFKVPVTKHKDFY